jgi:hypothetical protein
VIVRQANVRDGKEYGREKWRRKRERGKEEQWQGN